MIELEGHLATVLAQDDPPDDEEAGPVVAEVTAKAILIQASKGE